MRKYVLALLVCIALLSKTVIAEVWINDDKAIVSDSGFQEVYLGYVGSEVLSTAELFGASNWGGVFASESPQYPSYFSLVIGSTLPDRNFQLPLNREGLFILYDVNHELVGTYSDSLMPGLGVYVGETYQVAPGQSVAFNGYSFKGPGYTEWVAGADYSEKCLDGWSIDGLAVPQDVSYEYLTNNLGLTAGTYELRLDATWDYGDIGGGAHLIFDNSDTTTITIVPEPATLMLLGLGGLVLRRRRA